MSSDFIFADEEPEIEAQEQRQNWKLLIIDDEPDIHSVTNLVLNDFEMDGAGLEILHAYSAEEAKSVFRQHSNIAMALVDVVMETTHAGLDLIKWIRNEHNEHFTRLILRTGQPGEAPEERVIRDYDINDYKNKTELTNIKLKTLLYATLRSYRDIIIIERHKKGLEKVIASTAAFLECDTLTQFASSILLNITSVLDIPENKIYCCAVVNHDSDSTDYELLATSDGNLVEPSLSSPLPPEVKEKLDEVHLTKQSRKDKDYFIGYFTSSRGTENLLYVSLCDELSITEHNLLEFFTNNIAVAYDNIRLREIVKESQKELSYLLAEAVEHRSLETGNHVKRVAIYCYMFAKYLGMSQYECEVIKLASPLHDVGKIAIPDAILNKPGKLDDEEWQHMQTHAEIGGKILSRSKNEIMTHAASIAASHHEKYDGSGYPLGTKGKDIPIFGRITALADVFDALLSRRCYKAEWSINDALDEVKGQSGKHFDPTLVDILVENIDEFIAVREAYPDLD